MGRARGELAAARARAAALDARATTERRAAQARLERARAALDAVGPELDQEARAALDGIEAAVRGGDLPLAEGLLLASQVLDGMDALLSLRLAVAEARLDLLLATEDPALLPRARRPEVPPAGR